MIDGAMGPNTSSALRDFQQAEGLRVTGRVDAETRSKLGI
ncbi:MAG: peptidoglycan-binding domain-containing protein [Candidatus Rokuibacteriota bacterium]